MNTRVTQMVELLFRDVEVTDEVAALHDEVLDNCQDRFDDLLKNGVSEDEALAAVVESLKGMEDVLKDYPRKGSAGGEKEPEKTKSTGEKAEEETDSREPRTICFNTADVGAIQAQLTGCDIEIAEGEGDKVVLEKQGRIHYSRESDGTLKIWQERVSENLFKGVSWEESFSSFEHFGDAINRIAQNFSNLFAEKVGTGGDEAGEKVVLRLPRTFHPDVNLRTTRGDINWSGVVPGSSLVLSTTSGDIRMRIDRRYLLQRAEITTISGDAEIKLSAETVRVNTVSGDITWEGDAGMLEMNSTSGDASAKGRIRRMDLNSTSGDLNLELEEDVSSEVDTNTVSGNINIRLPDTVNGVVAKLSTVSGETRTRGVDLVNESPVVIQAKTVSGNLVIAR